MGLIPGQGTKILQAVRQQSLWVVTNWSPVTYWSPACSEAHMMQLESPCAATNILHAITRTQCSQINNSLILKKGIILFFLQDATTRGIKREFMKREHTKDGREKWGKILGLWQLDWTTELTNLETAYLYVCHYIINLIIKTILSFHPTFPFFPFSLLLSSRTCLYVLICMK